MGDYSQLSSTNPKIYLKIDHHYNNNPKYPKLCIKRNKEKKKKREELEQAYQVGC